MQLKANTYYQQRNLKRGYCGCRIPDDLVVGGFCWLCVNGNCIADRYTEDGFCQSNNESPDDFVEEWHEPEVATPIEITENSSWEMNNGIKATILQKLPAYIFEEYQWIGYDHYSYMRRWDDNGISDESEEYNLKCKWGERPREVFQQVEDVMWIKKKSTEHFGPQDVPFGSVLRRRESTHDEFPDGWAAVIAVMNDSVAFTDGRCLMTITFPELTEKGFEIRRPGEDWRPF